ncbi:unnamed protein product [Meganyctiphanes norvegica]|uniref:Uncharacterized protein n=1 Tax=Meganyctiphanes norvegica TaxID=48144 RepID=A0AAV2Q9X7_MEGNR
MGRASNKINDVKKLISHYETISNYQYCGDNESDGGYSSGSGYYSEEYEDSDENERPSHELDNYSTNDQKIGILCGYHIPKINDLERLLEENAMCLKQTSH